MADVSENWAILPPSDNTATELLQAWGGGDLEARDRLVSLLYLELRRRASAQLRRERNGHTWQPSDLVHEACLKLLDQRVSWRNRAHFLAVASQLMRRILVDRARARLANKRPGAWAQVTLDLADLPIPSTNEIDLIDLDSALSSLATFDARKGKIAELRFFGGLSLEETGHVLNLSSKTVERDWQAARAWLFKVLSNKPRAVDSVQAGFE